MTAPRIAALAALLLALPAPAQDRKHDLSREKVLYCVGYAHLDTQWRWDFTTTVDKYIRATLDENFDRIETYPGYVFNFTGSVRYGMMKEYYPEKYEQLKRLVAANRWFVSGSSVDEGDVNVPSAEAVLRQVLYGNRFFRREFGKESVDYMLPDCFGFPASMPSIWAHAGLKGFSTQKLTWGSAVGIPFKIGVWEGPDGKSVLAALDPGSYGTGLSTRVDLDPGWVERVERNGREYGVFADYHYYGVGDEGGAPREEHVRNYTASVGNSDGKIQVELGSSDQLFRDVTPEQAARLPRYKGDMLLTEHSAGTLTSQAYMKRWNRKGEILADAAERAAAMAGWVSGMPYPQDALERSWERLLANQMHDILPGTSIPRAYTFSWNDEIVAQNGFAGVLAHAVAEVAAALDTRTEGVPLVVSNALAIPRQDPVEAEVAFEGDAPEHVRVFGPDGREAPSQVLARTDRSVTVLFLADVPPVSATVFEVRSARSPWPDDGRLTVSERVLQSPDYRVSLDEAGDVVSIVDRRHGNRELLREPARLVFTREKPRAWPAWNMDWADRQKPPVGVVGGPATVRIVERGPVRVSLEVTRQARNSVVVQRIRLHRGDQPGRRVEFDTAIDWQSAEVALRAAFPLTVSNPTATYNWGLGTIERGNNDPAKYEVPSHEWFDLTDRSGAYGVTVVEDSKYGSDKPDDSTLRLTLLYSPGVRRSYQDQHSQDWGRHEMRYALAGHAGDWRAAGSEWLGRQLNQPLRAFQTARHAGTAGRVLEFARTTTSQVDIRAIKKAEDGDHLVVRLQELWGKDAQAGVRLGRGIATAWEVDGQERRIGDAVVKDGSLAVTLTPYSPRSFAVTLVPSGRAAARPRTAPVPLPYDADVVSPDAARDDGRLDGEGRTLPAEMLPDRVVSQGVPFELGPEGGGAANAVACRGQAVAVPRGAGRLSLLATAEEDVTATLRVGETGATIAVPSWTGFVGQWDDRIWDRAFEEVDHRTEGKVTGFRTGYIKHGTIAWFATHRHHPRKGNEAYRFSYLWKVDLDLPEGTREVRLPDDPRVKVLAATASWDPPPGVRPAAPLLDDFDGRPPVALRHVYPPPPAPLEQGIAPAGSVSSERAETFAALSSIRPDATDAGRSFRVVDPTGEWAPHRRAGAAQGALPRLDDGEVARNDDDVDRCAWFDNEGRFVTDLGAARRVRAVRTFSWHRDERAPQRFTLWGSDAETPPDPAFGSGQQGGWTLLGVVDTRGLGQGGVHATEVTFDRPVRHLLWVAPEAGNGTFFTEVDVDVAP